MTPITTTKPPPIVRTRRVSTIVNRRDCLDHVIALGGRHLRRVLAEYAGHYNRGRPHMSLGPGIPDPPEGISIEERGDRHLIPEGLEVVASPVLSGLHHEYRLQKVVA